MVVIMVEQQTVRDVYERIYRESKELYIHYKYSENEATRSAIIYAVQNAWEIFNDEKGLV